MHYNDVSLKKWIDKMKILAIDSTTEVCSAALMNGDEVAHRKQKAPRQHAKLILPMIEELLIEVGYKLSDLDALALTIGPGSFTGLRIAAGVVQGLAYGADLPVAIISTLAVLAQGAYEQFNSMNLLPALDARMQQVYWGAYRINKHGLAEPMIDDSVSDPDKVCVPKDDNWIGVGSGWQVYSDGLKKRIGQQLQIYPDCYPEAKYILSLAKDKFERNELVTAAEVLPIYLRDMSE